jgi:hypothetical protein
MWRDKAVLIEQKIILEQIRELLAKIEKHTAPRLLTSFKVHIGGHMAKIGDVLTARIVNPKDQFGQPFPLDLTQTPPAWTLSNGSVASQSPSLDGSDAITALAAGSETVTATIGSVSASAAFNVDAPPAAVLTTFEVELS